MPSPFGDCERSDGYVESECLANCEAKYVISNCSCKDAYMPGNRQHSNHTIVKLDRRPFVSVLTAHATLYSQSSNIDVYVSQCKTLKGL